MKNFMIHDISFFIPITAIDKGVNLLDLCCIRSLKLDFQLKRRWAFFGGRNYEFGWKSSFPFWMGIPEVGCSRKGVTRCVWILHSFCNGFNRNGCNLTTRACFSLVLGGQNPAGPTSPLPLQLLLLMGLHPTLLTCP